MELQASNPPTRSLSNLVSALHQLKCPSDLITQTRACRTAEEIVKLLTADLRLTTSYLMVHPKVYWIWTHRKWCLESVPLGPDDTEEWRIGFWKMELGLIEKMLDVDARNCTVIVSYLYDD
jgi:hypothetical protein